MKKIVWTPTARKSFQETKDFLTELWNEQVTDEFLNQLDYRIEQIKRNPQLAPTFKNSEFRQLLVHKTVSLFYKIYPDHIKLLLIWDNRQDPTQLQKRINQ